MRSLSGGSSHLEDSEHPATVSRRPARQGPPSVVAAARQARRGLVLKTRRKPWVIGASLQGELL
jgi:hypothetical protein